MKVGSFQYLGQNIGGHVVRSAHNVAAILSGWPSHDCHPKV